MSKFKISEAKLRQIIREELRRTGADEIIAERGVWQAIKHVSKEMGKTEKEREAERPPPSDLMRKIAAAARKQLPSDLPGSEEITADVEVEVDGKKYGYDMIQKALKALR